VLAERKRYMPPNVEEDGRQALPLSRRMWAKQVFAVYGSGLSGTAAMTDESVRKLITATLGACGTHELDKDKPSTWTLADLERWIAKSFYKMPEIEFVDAMLNACMRGTKKKKWEQVWVNGVQKARKDLGVLKVSRLEPDEKPEKPVNAWFDMATFARYFTRYDPEGTGMLRGHQDLAQLTVNLCNNMLTTPREGKQMLSVKQINSAVEAKIAAEPSKTTWTQGEYKGWFIETFAPPEGTPRSPPHLVSPTSKVVPGMLQV